MKQYITTIVNPLNPNRQTFEVNPDAKQGTITLKAKKALGILSKTITKPHGFFTYKILSEDRKTILAYVEEMPSK